MSGALLTAITLDVGGRTRPFWDIVESVKQGFIEITDRRA
jgi:hypothetical protein